LRGALVKGACAISSFILLVNSALVMNVVCSNGSDINVICYERVCLNVVCYKRSLLLNWSDRTDTVSNMQFTPICRIPKSSFVFLIFILY